MSADWATGALGGGIVAGGVGFTKWMLDKIRKDAIVEKDVSRLEESDDGLREDLRALRDKLDEALHKFSTAATLGQAQQDRQNSLNESMLRSFEALAAKVDTHGDKIADLSSTVRLLSDTMALMRQQLERKADKQ